MKKILITLSVVMILSSCLRLDDFLYAPEQVDEYKLNDIEAKDLVIPADFLMDEDKIYEFGLTSKNKEGGDETIYAIYLGDTASIKTDTVIVYCHGNAYHLDGYWQRATLLANLGFKNRYGVLIMDYQGYGRSSGKAYEEGLYKDVDVCVQWLAKKGLEGNQLIYYGFSMGSAPATELTSKVRTLKPQKLILEAPFASGAMLVNDATPLNLPGTYATNLKIDNAEEIKRVEQPFMWLHGENDDFLSLKFHGQVVYDNYQGSYSEKLISKDAGHGDFPTKIGLDLYQERLLKFIER